MSHEPKHLDWSINDTAPALSSRRSLRCALPCEQAASLVLAAAKSKGLRVAGFRLGRAPVKLVYAYHQRICDGEIVTQLRRNQPDSLLEMLSKAFTPPEFKAVTWDGESDFQVEVSCFEQPTAPDPAAAFGKPAGLMAEPLTLPKPGTGVNVAGFLPPALQAQGVLTGLHLQSSLGLVDQPRQQLGSETLGSSGIKPPGSTVAAHLPSAARAAPGLDPHPAPAVPRADAPEPKGRRTTPEESGYATPVLATPEAPRARANPPLAAPAAPPAAIP